MSFPKRLDSHQKGDIGVQIVSKSVAKDLRMIFRSVPQEYDYGVDGHIDYVAANGDVTGGSVAVQIKHGASFFTDETVDGYWFTGDDKHLNFLINHSLTVFIFLVHPDEQVYWVEFDPTKLQKSGSQWKILIPKTNLLSKNFVRHIEKLFDIVDFSSDIKDHLETIDTLRIATGKVKHTLLAIGRQSIEAENTQGTLSFFSSLKVNKQTIKNHEGKVSFFVYGYDDDDRELYDIPEVVNYFKKIDREVKYWFYFLSKDREHSHALKVLMAITCNAKKNNANASIIEISPVERKKFFERNFIYLNEMTEFLGLPISENKRITEEVFNYFEWVNLSDNR